MKKRHRAANCAKSNFYFNFNLYSSVRQLLIMQNTSYLILTCIVEWDRAANYVEYNFYFNFNLYSRQWQGLLCRIQLIF